MPVTTVIVKRNLLFVAIITTGIARLSAQTISLEEPISFTGYNKPTKEIPVKKIYDEDARSWYAVYNTDNVVHVYVATTNPQQQRKIVMNGIDLWIDIKGKKNKKTGISFPYIDPNDRPAPPTQVPRPNFFNNSDTPDSTRRHDLSAIIARQHEMKLTGFKEELNGGQNINHPSGIHASVYFVQDTLVYEAQLPLNTLSEPVAVNSRISVGIIEKGMGMPGMNDGGMPPPDGGGPGGEGMMPPPGPPNGGPISEDGMRIFEDNIIWYKFSL